MKAYLLALCLFITFSNYTIAQKNQNISNEKITTYYLVRHAEKDRSNPEDNNPNLTTEGLQRAERWNTVLSNITFDAVYTTNFNRTQQTVASIAEKNNLKPIIYEARELVNDSFISATNGKTVFIVGHSNTIPQIVNTLIGTKKYNDINDNENGSLFIITLIGNQVTDQLLIIN